MCGRYSQTADQNKIKSRFRVESVTAIIKPRFNIAPTQEAPVVVQGEKRELRSMHWGLVPSWAKDIKIGNRMINARAETVAGLPTFSDSFRHRRCILPATGFYEWQTVGGRKVPHRFRLASGGVMGFAGLWSLRRGAGG